MMQHIAKNTWKEVTKRYFIPFKFFLQKKKNSPKERTKEKRNSHKERSKKKKEGSIRRMWEIFNNSPPGFSRTGGERSGGMTKGPQGSRPNPNPTPHQSRNQIHGRERERRA